MTTFEPKSLYDIEKNALEYLKEQLEYNAELDDNEICFNNDDGDTIAEVADSSVPIYTSDLMQLAANNIDLAVVVPELGPAFDGESTPVNIVAANVYEAITAHLWENIDRIKNEITEEMIQEHKDKTLICYYCNEDIEEGDIIGEEVELKNNEIATICLNCYEKDQDE